MEMSDQEDLFDSPGSPGQVDDADSIDASPPKKDSSKRLKEDSDDDADLEVGDDEVDAAFRKEKKSKKKSSTKKKSKTDSAEKETKKRRRVSEGKSKKKYRGGAGSMFLDEAAEAEDDELEEDIEAEIDQKELTAEEKAANERVDKRNKMRAEDKRTAEEIAQEFEKRAKAERKYEKHIQLEAARSARGNKFIKPAALPDFSDPHIYKVRCKPGQEEIAIRSILLKSFAMQKMDGQFKVKSAFTGNTKGYIYVEASSDTFVSDIIGTLRMIYSNSVSQLPLKEMTQVLEVTATKKPLEKLQFVRLKRGNNKGDLARVLEVREGGEKALIQVVPRVEYLNQESKLQAKQLAIQSNSKVRPPQRLFDAEAARAVSEHEYLRRGSHPDAIDMICDVFGNDYFHNGFLIKYVQTDVWLNANDPKPTLEELKLFQTDAASLSDLREDTDAEGETIANSTDNSLAIEIARIESTKLAASPFVSGDMVQVTSGDLANMIAKVVSVDDKAQIAKIIPVGQAYLGTMNIEISNLIKYVTTGAHVKVMAGQYAGQTGHVVSVSSGGKDAIAAILTDGLNTEIQCNVSFLQMSDEVAIGSGSLAGYEIYDLVCLNDNESAVVITVGAQKLRVINHLGVVKDISPQEIRFKQNSQSARASCSDATKARFVVGDILNVISGRNSKKSGTVKHISKGIVWLHNNHIPQNSGVIVVRGHECTIAGANRGGASAANFGNALNAAKSSTPSNSSTPLSAYSNRTPGGNTTLSGPNAIKVGSTVRIVQGEYRSLNGVVTNVDGNFVQVELSARMKKIYITKDKLKVVERVADSFSQPSSNIYEDQFVGMETPQLASQTPSWLGASTPNYLGSETPGGVGSETPSFFSSTSSRVDDPWRITENELNDASDKLNRSETPGATPRMTPSEERRIPTSLTVTPNSSILSTPVPTPVGSSSAFADFEYAEGMVVLVREGENTGKLAVVTKSLVHIDSVKLRLRDGSGHLAGDEFTLSNASIKPKDPPKKAIAKILSGAHGGKTGIVQKVVGKDIFVTLDGSSSTDVFKLNNVAWMNSA